MKLNHFGKKIMGGVFALSLIFGIGMAMQSTVHAQYRNDQYPRDRNDQNRNRNDDRDRDRERGQRHRGRNWDGYPNWGGSFELRQTALNAGYNEGIKQGRNDARRRDRGGYGYQNSSAYQKATKDYSSRLGDKELYRRYFREAFPNGYDDGMRGY